MKRNMNTYISILTLFYFVLCRVHANGTALTFELPDRRRFCLNERFEGAKDYILEYRVIRGGKHDVDVHVRSPNGKILHKNLQVKEGIFEFETSRGDYSFCFSNEFSTWTHKIVYVDLRPRDLDSLAGEAGVVKPNVQTSSENSCEEVHEHLTAVVLHQRNYRLKESISRHLAEILRAHVTWLSVAHTISILITGIGQSLILKRFFTEKTPATPRSTTEA